MGVQLIRNFSVVAMLEEKNCENASKDWSFTTTATSKKKNPSNLSLNRTATIRKMNSLEAPMKSKEGTDKANLAVDFLSFQGLQDSKK